MNPVTKTKPDPQNTRQTTGPKHRISISSQHIPNCIVLIRIILIFVVMILLTIPAIAARITGLILLVSAAVLDWFDGYLARKLRAISLMGGMLDTLADRITENALLIFFCFKGLIPLPVPLIFITRSLLSDFIRFLYLRRGISTFSVHESTLGRLLVASRLSRIYYLLSKITVFVLASIALILEISPAQNTVRFDAVKSCVYLGAIWLVIFSLLRFSLLLYDARTILKEEFHRPTQ